MPIVAECPHCESRFTLQPDLAGKAMRCPNPDCREVFVVQDATPPPPPSLPDTVAVPVRLPKPTSGQVDDFVPVLDIEPEPPPKPPPKKKAPPPEPTPEPVIEAVPVVSPPTPPPTPPTPPPEPIVGEVVEAVVEPVVVEAALVAAPPVREVVWSPDAEVPSPPGFKRRERERDDEPLILTRRRKKGSRWPVFALIGMVGVVVIAGIWGGLVWFQRATRAEAELARQADEQYKAGDYSAAAKTYDQLAREYPGSDDRGRYEFLSALATLQRDVRSVAVKEDPGPAIARVLAFIETHKDSPLAKPGEGGFGGEVLAAGRKVADDAAEHAEGRLKAFRADRSKSGELEQARQVVVAGRELVQKLDPLRGSSDQPFDGVRLRFDNVEKDIAFEWNRWEVLAELRPLLERPTDASVEAAKEKLAANGLTNDAEASKLVQDASAMLGRQVRYEPAPAAPLRPPADYAASIAFLAPVGPTLPLEGGGLANDHKSGVFLAVSRGLVYAFDEDLGASLWAVRVGPGVTDPPAVATVDTAEGPTGLAVVVSHVAGRAAVAGHDLRTGVVRWYQPLPAPPAGPAVVVGTRGFVALRDPDGTVIEFDLTSGNRVGKVTLVQPIGPAPVLRPGTGLIYLTADARRVYVLDVAARDVEGNRLPPRCAQVLATGHLPGTVRTPPLFLGPEGDAPAERWLVLSQVAGPTEMRLRAFPLPPFQPPSADGLPPPGVAVPPAVTVSLPGWAWFPPTTDGERLAAVTDSGELRLFGVNQPGNQDPILFPLPHPQFTALPDGGVPGLVIPAEEGAFWVLAGGAEARKVRVALDPVKGQIADVFPRTIPPGKPTLAGIPTQPAVLNARRDTAFFVVRSADSPACRAVAFDLTSGEVRWQRQLGVVASAAPVGPNGVVLAGEDGCTAVISPAVPSPESGGTRLTDLVVAPPLDGLAGRTVAAASADGSVVYTLTLVRHQGKPAVAVRKFVGGRMERDGRVPAESPLAGPAVVLGDTVVFPAANGFVYRVAWAEPGVKDEGRFDRVTLAPGPRWRPLDRANSQAVCFLAPLGADRLAVSDGERTISVWLWPADGAEQPAGTTWTLPQPVAAPPLFLPGRDNGPGRVLVADATGGLWLFAADRGGEPLRRWRPDGTEVPVGKPTSGFAAQLRPGGELSIAYVVEGRNVLFLDPDRENWRWADRGEDKPERLIVGTPQPAGGGRWLVTDLGGRVTLFDPATRQRLVVGEIGLSGVVPTSAGVLTEPSRVVVPLSDGSAAVIGFATPEVAPPPRPIGGP